MIQMKCGGARAREKQQQKVGSLGPMRGSGVARRVHHNNERQREKKPARHIAKHVKNTN